MAQTLAETWTPSVAGEQCAQDLYLGDQDPERVLHEYRWQVTDYYNDLGYRALNPKKAHAHIVRWVLRAASAPLLLEIETALADDVKALGAPDSGTPMEWPVIEPDREAFICHRIKNARNIPYTPAQWQFLNVTSHMAYQAGVRWLGRLHNEPSSRMAILFGLFKKIDIESSYIYPFPEEFKMRQEPRERLLDNLLTSSITTLQTLEVARRHGVEHATEQLGWLATTSQAFFDRYFGDDFAAPDAPCPFASKENYEQTGSIWKTKPLNEGPWPSRRYCPENVPFWDGRRYRYTTAATERLKSTLPIARQILWRPETEDERLAQADLPAQLLPYCHADEASPSNAR